MTYMKEFRICIQLAYAFWNNPKGLDLQSGCERFFTDDLSKAKVSKLDMQIFISEKDILRLDVSMHDTALVLM